MTVFSDALVDDLEVEWRAVAAASARSVGEWDEAFGSVAAEYRVLEESGRWATGPDDAMTLLGMGRTELAHSTMLAWLLRPDASHGLGAGLFRRLVAAVIPDVADPGPVELVRCEVSRDDTRADIVVWAGRVTLIIENKVDAGEGIRQCERLHRHFSNEPNPRFLFLTPDGSPPATAGVVVEEFVPVSYRTVVRVLAAALDEARRPGPPGREVAASYLRTCRRMFG